MDKKIFNTVEAALNNAELHYNFDGDDIFRFTMKGEHANYDVRLLCEEDMELLMTSTQGHISAPLVKY